ncbi:hypothetical protein ACH5RR_038409 [Cinchona calisaya]|uniref:ERCC3/RAD25/XPB helicase C-terminal domain-containing protein n=1 Tax=Cinchona calisaya TaxID=153742 RepID=A0ABD2XXS5_9GENT
MVGFGGKHSKESEKIIEEIRNREWGLLLIDEVHVVPARMFRKVISLTSLTRSDKAVVFVDNLFALREYAMKLRKPMIYRATRSGVMLVQDVKMFKDLDLFSGLRKCSKRQQVLIDQGYSFKVITSLPPPDSRPELSYHCLDEQIVLLGKVLIAGDDVVGLEQLEEDADGMTLQKAHRSTGYMSVMSGASGMVYMEYKCGYF